MAKKIIKKAAPNKIKYEVRQHISRFEYMTRFTEKLRARNLTYQTDYTVMSEKTVFSLVLPEKTSDRKSQFGTYAKFWVDFRLPQWSKYRRPDLTKAPYNKYDIETLLVYSDPTFDSALQVICNYYEVPFNDFHIEEAAIKRKKRLDDLMNNSLVSLEIDV